MSGPPAGGPRFRIVAGRGLGERGTTNPPQLQQHQQQHVPSPQPLPPQQPQELRVVQEGRLSNVPSPASVPHPQVSQVMMGSQMGPGSPAESDMQVVDKCVRFFKTLFAMSHNAENYREYADGTNTVDRVRELIYNILLEKFTPEQFTEGLSNCLKSTAQPHLTPFLRKTVPHVREALRRGTVPEGFEIPMAIIEQLRECRNSSPRVMDMHGPGSVGGGGSSTNMIPVSQMAPGPATPNPPQQQQQPMHLHQQQQPQHHHHYQQQQPQQQQQVQQTIKQEPQPIQMQQQTVQQLTQQDVEMEEMKPEDEVFSVRALQENALKCALIPPDKIMQKITDRMREATYVEEEVLTLLSDAAEYRLREILAELVVLADHRMENLRMSQNYAVVDDTKAQIRFLENLDRQRFEQTENLEKEALIRLSKGKGQAKETIEKAKEIKRIDDEAKRNRDANAAAIAALSSKSQKPRWDNTGFAGAAGAGQQMRPKTIRVNIRDFQVLANSDSLCAKSNIVHKLALGGSSGAEGI